MTTIDEARAGSAERPDSGRVTPRGVELRHLRYFVTVADQLHFGRAAEKLGIAQPTLSELVRRLEREMDTPLLARTTRRAPERPKRSTIRSFPCFRRRAAPWRAR